MEAGWVRRHGGGQGWHPTPPAPTGRDGPSQHPSESTSPPKKSELNVQRVIWGHPNRKRTLPHLQHLAENRNRGRTSPRLNPKRPRLERNNPEAASTMMRDPPGLNGRYGLASKQGDLLMEACRWQVFFYVFSVSRTDDGTGSLVAGRLGVRGCSCNVCVK